MGEPFQIETVCEKQVHRRGEDQLQQSTVKKGQLQLQAVEIDVFEVRGEVATLVIQHQEKMECTNGIRAADAVQLHANAFRRVPAEGLRNAGAQEAANDSRTVAFEKCADGERRTTSAQVLRNGGGEVHVAQPHAAAIAGPHQTGSLG